MELLDMYYYAPRFDSDDSEYITSAKRKAVQLALSKIIESELSDRQSICIRLHYTYNLPQNEIARRLGISQPTVSRHISTAKKIINDKLKYCYLATSAALNEYEKGYA